MQEDRLYLSDIMNKTNLDSKDWVLVRHTLNDPLSTKCRNLGREGFEEFQKFQPNNYFNGKKYIIAFIGGVSATARFFGVYEVAGILNHEEFLKAPKMDGFPYDSFKWEKDTVYYDLKRRAELEMYQNRLIIDWGKGVANIKHYDASKKTVLSILDNISEPFPGYENVCLTFDKMCEVVINPEYEAWQNALKSVYGVYLVVDTVEGKQYVGSAYGKNGILERWQTYANTQGTGGSVSKEEGNKGIIAHLKEHPGRNASFQYTILQILPKTYTADQVIAVENSWKEKLCTRGKWGLNCN